MSRRNLLKSSTSSLIIVTARTKPCEVVGGDVTLRVRVDVRNLGRPSGLKVISTAVPIMPLYMGLLKEIGVQYNTQMANIQCSINSCGV